MTTPVVDTLLSVSFSPEGIVRSRQEESKAGV
jgi:hypothetical protein